MTATPVVAAQAVTSTPRPTAPTATPGSTPAPTATVVPPPVSALPAAPAPIATVVPESEQESLTEVPEEGGGLGGATIAIIAVVGIAVIAGGFGVGQAVLARRREA